jgi:hypothetical protein
VRDLIVESQIADFLREAYLAGKREENYSVWKNAAYLAYLVQNMEDIDG